MKNYELYSHHKIETLKELLSFCAEAYGSKPAFQYTSRKTDVEISFLMFKRDADALGSFLLHNGYRGCHIAVFGENSYEWILTYFAVVCSGNVIVPIDRDLNAAEAGQLLQDSDCKAMLYSQTYGDIVETLKNTGMDNISFISMKSIPDMIAEKPDCTEYLNTVVSPDDLASIVYTSGTVGKSKGVMLTHKNLASDTYASCCTVQLTGPSILILPLHHTFGLVAGVLAAMLYGLPVYINKSLKNLSGDFQKYKPNHIFAVPLIVETLYKNIWSTAKKQGKEKALRTLIKISDALLKFGIDLRPVFFRTVLAAFGGKLSLIVSGGAPLDKKFIAAFKSFGITLLNGYGITECGPVVAVNRNKFNIAGSVGVPICSNQVEIAGDGEILVRGDNVMPGYYNDPASNKDAFSDGWFKTGDLGFFDEHGALHISGRKKNLIILSNGENIAAEWLESQVYTIPYVKETIVYGQNDVITAEVYLDEEVTDAQKHIYADIQNLNRNLPQIKNIGNVIVRNTEFPKTTTKKIKRNYGGVH